MKHLLPACLVLGLAVAVPATQAAAQVTTAFDGFSNQSNEPVNIEADRLEVRDKDQAATFSGNVEVVQGQSRLKSRELTVFYVGGGGGNGAGSGAAAAGNTAPGGRAIRRLEAAGNVVVTSSDQRATGDRGVFDMGSNTVVLSGNVVVAQGPNVIRGERLHVDLTRKTSRIETGSGGRVRGIFMPGDARKPAPAQRN